MEVVAIAVVTIALLCLITLYIKACLGLCLFNHHLQVYIKTLVPTSPAQS